MDFELGLLGRFRVLRDQQEIPPAAFRQRLVRRLLRLLISHRGEYLSRDAVTEALWPARPPADPAANLRVLVALARRALGDPSLVLTSSGGYCFSADDRCVVDTEVFLSALDGARRELGVGRPDTALRRVRPVLDHWSGEPLAEDAYEDWAQAYRDRLLRARGEALELAASAALAVHRPREAAAWAAQAALENPLREPAQLLLAQSLAASGDTEGALRTLRDHRVRFAEELGLDPSEEVDGLERRLLQGWPAEEAHGPAAAPRPSPAAGRWDLPFVGRQVELETALAALKQEPSPVLVVEGLAGCGKSRLLRELASCCDVAVIEGRALPAEREEAWALARRLLRDALALDFEAAKAIPDRAAQALAEILPELEELRPLTRHAIDAESRRALTMQGAARLVLSAAAGGAILALDDAQWADATSLALVGLLLERMPALLAVLACNAPASERPQTLTAFLDDLPRLRRRRVDVGLGPLPAEALAGLFTDPGLAAAVAEEAQGNPAAAADIISGLAAQGAVEVAGDGRLRPRVAAAAEAARSLARTGRRLGVEAAIRRQPDERKRTLGLLTLLGREAPGRLVATAKGVPQAAVLEELDALARADLVRLGDEGWTTGPLVAEVVEEHIGRTERACLHGMLAEALGGAGVPGERAEHLWRAGDPEAAAEAYARAGRASLERCATEEAGRLADAGLRICPEGAARMSLLDVRAEARARQADLAGAREDLRALLGHLPRGPQRATTLARMATVVADAQDLQEAEELVEAALIEAGPDPTARGEVLATGAILDLNAGRIERGELRAGEARRLFEEAGDAEGVARTADTQAMAYLGHGRFVEAAEGLTTVAHLFLDAGMLLRAGTTKSYLALTLLQMNRPDDAHREAAEAHHLEAMLGHHDAWLARAIDALALAGLGRLDEALPAAEETAAAFRSSSHRYFWADSLVTLGIVHRAARDLERAESCLREALDVGRGIPLATTWAAAVLARLLVERGELDEAERYVALATGEGAAPMWQFEGRLARAELAAARHDPDAGKIAREALAVAEAGGHFSSAAVLRGLALGDTTATPGV